MNAAAFDALAADYDADFTNTPVGSALRALVWSRADRLFAGAARILDLGCGTGADAVHLASGGARVVALDASAAMVRTASENARQSGWATRVQLHCLPMEQLGDALPAEVFDGVLSNFGALNCVRDLAPVAREVAAKLVPGGRLLWVFMGRYVPWEWGWYLLQAAPARAGRRLRGTTRWRGMNIAYPSPGAVARVLAPYFRVDALRPLGVALPPSYAAQWLNRRPRVLNALQRLEALAQGMPALAYCADHYMIEATRLPVSRGANAAAARGA